MYLMFRYGELDPAVLASQYLDPAINRRIDEGTATMAEKALRDIHDAQELARLPSTEDPGEPEELVDIAGLGDHLLGRDLAGEWAAARAIAPPDDDAF